MTKGCDHKFIDSNRCAKCGWEVPRNVRPVNPEPLRAVPPIEMPHIDLPERSPLRAENVALKAEVARLTAALAARDAEWLEKLPNCGEWVSETKTMCHAPATLEHDYSDGSGAVYRCDAHKKRFFTDLPWASLVRRATAGAKGAR